ncbi:PREDICTED: uncharacterized protein LOC109157266 [Ipomoea nil]|uniref:uncharacterized protein LOC109157266 n=1 Tax=Ipomoea nil TaxID=35883 RepID=UPI0009012749|nr:PREDICTED: uncharacterized protein LOC109157266 [Ipomoea nil]
MAKAYDRMEWPYLEGMLAAFGFDQNWINLLMLCVSTVRYSIQAEGSGSIHGVRIARRAPPVSHLFFADDSLLFFRASCEEAQSVKDCLDRYSSVSGQLINYDKSSAMFSANTKADVRAQVSACIGVRETTDFGKYLGLPSVLGRNKSATFQYIEDTVRATLSSWQHRLLSKAGKEIMLKSVAQALPIFTMSVFLLPVRLCDRLEKLFNRYWWGGGKSNNKGVHWMSWRRLSIPKYHGGLGFRKLHEFNVALLAKQGWRLLTTPQSLVSQLLKAKYCPNCDFTDAVLGNNPSYMWRSILAGQHVLKAGLARRIGNGRNTKIWDWPWLADRINTALNTVPLDHLREERVSGLLNEDGQWDVELIRDLFDADDVRRILATPTAVHVPDSWRWVGDTRGLYSVKHGYKLLTSQTTSNSNPEVFDAWDKLWKLPVPPKVWVNDESWQGETIQTFIALKIKDAHEEMVVRMAAVIWSWKEVYKREHTTGVLRDEGASWDPPPLFWLKCNVDATLTTSGAGFGAVLRDHIGRFVAARNGRLTCDRDPLMAEACAVREALLWLRNNGRNHVIIESDCLVFCNAFNSSKLDLSCVGLVVKQCTQIARDIGDVAVRHVRRSANRVAHALPRVTDSMTDSESWSDVPPDCISGLLA